MQIDLAAFTANGFDARAFSKRGTEIEQASLKAKVLVVDLRTNQPAWIAASAMTYFANALPAIEQWPLQRVLEHRGWRTQEGQTSGGYYSTFITTGAKPVGKPKPTGPQYVVFVADARSTLPVEAFALQANGRAMIVSSGALDPAATVDTVEVALPGDFTAHVRLGESLWGAPTADVIAKDPRPRAVELAKTAAPKPRTPKQVDLPPLRVRDDADYADALYPSRELRVLAGVRVWATLDRFFPYRYLIADWDAVAREMLPRLEAAADRDAYIAVLREMGARTGDGHVGVGVAKIDPNMKPRGTIGAYLRLVEGKATVLRTVDAEAEKLLAAGDVVEAIDGKPVAQLLAQKRPITSAGTEAARDQRIVRDLGFGDAGTTVKLAVRDARGKLRDVSLSRSVANMTAIREAPAIAHWKKLPKNIGYVNLMLLTPAEVSQMLDELKDTRGIVFDLRGYPNGVAWTLAPRLNVKQAKHAAQFLLPIVTGDSGDVRMRFFQEISQLPKDVPLYRGKVVVLIDDRAVSQSEHTCLFLSEAAGATFVGSPTHGTNGDITAMRLPGGLRMWFTGQEVRWVDGRPLQKVGVQPHVLVRPTLKGIRAGRDEVLDRGVSAILSVKS
jgi:C-terminal processing protease CtpA/Prc